MKALSSIDIYYWLKENKEKIVGSKIQRIKQKDLKFCFVLKKGKEKYYFEIFLPNAFYLADKCFVTKEFPPPFCMLLRKYLENQTVKEIVYKNFERILELKTENFKIIIELIPPSNLILTDLEDKIIACFYEREWKDRVVKKGELYKYPPKVVNILEKSFFDLQKIFSQTEKEIVKFLAKDCGLSGKYAEEICFLTKIDKNKKCSDLTQREIDSIQNKLKELLNKEIDAKIYLEANSFIDFSPFKLNHKKQSFIDFSSFNEAIKTFYKNLEKKITQQKIEKIKEKQRKIREEQTKKLKEFLEKEALYRKIGEIIFQNYSQLNSIIQEMLELREKKVKWKEIQKILKERYSIVKRIAYKIGKIVFEIDGLEFEIDYTKSLEKNVNEYFEKAKKLKKKIESLKEIIKQPVKIEIQTTKKEIEIKKEKKWYEKFRWFISSNGFLIVSGKDAETNEELIRKYLGKYDLVLHADIHGSPFTVIKNEKKIIPLPPETIYEAAQFTASFSRAWDLKLGSIHVYYFTPDQIVKRGGLPKGSFIIKGKRGWLEKIKLRVSIGVVINEEIKIVYGPPGVVRKKTPYLITLMPGDKKGLELAKEIKRELLSKLPFEVREEFEKIPEEKFLELIPYGKGEIVK